MRFEDLEVWKRAVKLATSIYRELRESKDYGFRDQITRAGLSVPSNIAEGFERESLKECIVFLSYAKGSCAELRTHVYVGAEIGYIANKIGQDWIRESVEISSMISSLMKTKRSFLKQK
jgi:four helix bundle protein